MNNENNYYKTPLLFMDDVVQLKEAIIVAQNHYGDQRNGTLDWDDYCQKRIDQLERVLYKIDSENYKPLPTPPYEEI
jgi:hypothetical protein